MRKRLLEKLTCPNFGTSDFRLFGVEINRNGQMLKGVGHDQIEDDDDIKEGVIVDLDAGTAYPISDYVASILSDEDADLTHYQALLIPIAEKCPAEYADIVNKSLDRLATANSTNDGTWNREEMAYYDADVATQEKRDAFLAKIKKDPLWHIYLEREQHLIDKANLNAQSSVLEIGCGNARTITWLARPKNIGFEYTGIDISWKRLLLARSVMPEGNFIQASALRLPFKDHSFSTAIAFGSLHHLPVPEDGFREAVKALTPDGLMLIHEPMDKPSLLPEGKFNWLRRMLTTYEHSDHDNEIDLDRFNSVILKEGLAVEHRYYNASLMRLLLTSGPLGRSLYPSRFWWRAVIWFDRMFIKLFCRKHGALGPAGVYMVLHKPVGK